jgi:hypothetical protein
MDYQKKYLKYKQKYLTIKNQIGNGILGDDVVRTPCVQPVNIRVIKNEEKNKIIILLGEFHTKMKTTIRKMNDKYLVERQNPKLGYDRFLGAISKNISIALKNKDGTHTNDPFRKTLFLIESEPSSILLGGKKELESDLFIHSEIDQEIGIYLHNRIEQMEDKYKPNMIKRSYDLRQVIEFHFIMSAMINYSINEEMDPIKIQQNIDESINNIKKYIINDEELTFPLPHYKRNNINIDLQNSLEAFNSNKTFFGSTYTRKSPREPKRLSEIYINTHIDYKYLKDMIIEEIDLIKKHPKIFINPAFNHLSIDEKYNMYCSLYTTLQDLICRLMDLYGLEYVSEMPNNSATVIISGAAHTNYLFSRLCIFDNYKLVESEMVKHLEKNIGGYPLYECLLDYPFTIKDELDEFNRIIKNTQKDLSSATPERKKYFYENILSSFPYYTYINNSHNVIKSDESFINPINPFVLKYINKIRFDLQKNEASLIKIHDIIPSPFPSPSPSPSPITLEEILLNKKTLINTYGIFFELLKFNREILFTKNILHKKASYNYSEISMKLDYF